MYISIFLFCLHFCVYTTKKVRSFFLLLLLLPMLYYYWDIENPENYVDSATWHKNSRLQDCLFGYCCTTGLLHYCNVESETFEQVDELKLVRFSHWSMTDGSSSSSCILVVHWSWNSSFRIPMPDGSSSRSLYTSCSLADLSNFQQPKTIKGDQILWSNTE